MIATGVALAMATNVALADEGGSWLDDFEISGEVKNESGFFTEAGSTIGDETVSYNHDATGKVKTVTNSHDTNSIMKSESSVRLFINGPIGESAELHAEIRPVRDSQGIKNYKGHEKDTQQDFLRELYIDTSVGEDEDVSLRIGKQQVVWGTADGMKLLDILNPTDYREMAQNSMDESRIPVWMLNAETDLENGANVQMVLSQPKENVFAGLNRNIDTAERSNSNAPTTPPGTSPNIAAIGHDKGHAFIMKGVDTITGASNGFLNITPDLGTISTQFSMGFDPVASGVGLSNLSNYSGFTVGAVGVGGFAAMTMGNMSFALGGATNTNAGSLTANFLGSVNKVYDMVSSNAAGTTAATNTTAGINVTGAQMLEYGFASAYDTNLASYQAGTTDSAFEYMSNATFKTFDTMVNATSQYAYDMPSDTDLNLGMRLKSSTDSGLNYSMNYSYNYDQNPIVDLSWRNPNGDKLTTTYETNYFKSSGGRQVTATSGTAVIDASSVGYTTTVILKDNNGTTYASGLATTTGGATDSSHPILRYTQKVKRAHNIGGALDTAIETEALGSIVLRGEALYQKDVYSPIIDKAKLSIGDLVGALEMHKGDRFKYVLGADVTLLTNMMVSAQFIQDRDLDYIDETSIPDANNPNVSGQRYTADRATMSMDNGFQKAEKNKEFYSLFMSKPFGAEQQHRWNNIFMYEENGGKWNRADVEYSFNDELIGSAEYNKYWGNENTQFGQLKNSTNLQLGLKYIF